MGAKCAVSAVSIIATAVEPAYATSIAVLVGCFILCSEVPVPNLGDEGAHNIESEVGVITNQPEITHDVLRVSIV